MKKNFIKFSMGLCLVAMIGGSSVNLNASGGGGGGGPEPELGYLMETADCPNGGTYNHCWTECTVDPANPSACGCKIEDQTSCGSF
jgi:hypothetical protein